MKTLLFLFLLAITLSASTCKEPFVEHFYDISVVNNSPDTIRVLLADKHQEHQYPDTSLPAERPALQIIAPGSRGVYDSRTLWEENLRRLPAGVLSVYIIDHAVYERTPWEKVRKEYKVLKRLDLRIADIEAAGYEVVYP